MLQFRRVEVTPVVTSKAWVDSWASTLARAAMGSLLSLDGTTITYGRLRLRVDMKAPATPVSFMSATCTGMLFWMRTAGIQRNWAVWPRARTAGKRLASTRLASWGESLRSLSAWAIGPGSSTLDRGLRETRRAYSTPSSP